MENTVTPLSQLISSELTDALWARQNSRTKPPGSLGRLEAVAVQVGQILNSATPKLSQPQMAVFAGDHGAADAGVSAFPKAVTAQMVLNFIHGGAAINVLTRQAGLGLTVINAGVDFDFTGVTAPTGMAFEDLPVARGSANYLASAAMSAEQCRQAMQAGADWVKRKIATGSNAFGFGEMGIGNTASASLLTHCLINQRNANPTALADVVGRGTGLDDAGVARKCGLLQQALIRVLAAKSLDELTPSDILTEFGGFEIAMMVGAILAAAQQRCLVVVDGFIVTSALLVAHAIAPAVLDYCVFSHQSEERGHAIQLAHLKAKPLLALDLRLGEGSGAALAFPLIQSALALLNDMAGFADAGVAEKSAH